MRIAIRNLLKFPIHVVSERGVSSTQDLYNEIKPDQELQVDVAEEGEITYATLPYLGATRTRNLTATRTRADVVLQWFTRRNKMRHRVHVHSGRIRVKIYHFADPVLYELKARSISLLLLRVLVPAALIATLAVVGILYAQASGKNSVVLIPTPLPTSTVIMLTPTDTAIPTLTPTLAPTATSAPPTPRPPTPIPPTPIRYRPTPTFTPTPRPTPTFTATTKPVPKPLVVTITNAPSTIYTDTYGTFVGTAYNPNTGLYLSGAELTWTATNPGAGSVVLGTGTPLTYYFNYSWNAGTSMLTLSANDPSGLVGSAQTTLTIIYGG